MSGIIEERVDGAGEAASAMSEIARTVLSETNFVSTSQTIDAVTVSPIGLTTSGVTVANNGAMFGPDTPGTSTQGLQEAATYAIGQVAGITGTIAPPRLMLLPGSFSIGSTINIPVPSGVSANGIGFEVQGSGHLSTIVAFSAGAGFMFGQYGWQDVVFRDMCIEQATGSTATSLISVVGTGTTFYGLRSEMMFVNVWWETTTTPANLPSNGCIYWGPYQGHTGGWDLYFTNCVMAGCFSITSPYDASFLNCLINSGPNGVTFTTTTPITVINSCEITGGIVLSGTNMNLRVKNSYWAQIPTTGAVSSTATNGLTAVTVRDSSMVFLGSGPVHDQSGGVIEMHYHGNNVYVAGGGKFALVGGGCYLSHTSTYGANYPDGFFTGPGAGIQSVTLPANPPVSGTGYQNALGIAVWIAVPVTYNPTSGAAASCVLYDDTGSLSTPVSTETYPAGFPAGFTATLRFRVPPGWFYKLVATNATIGTATVTPEQ